MLKRPLLKCLENSYIYVLAVCSDVVTCRPLTCGKMRYELLV